MRIDNELLQEAQRIEDNMHRRRSWRLRWTIKTGILPSFSNMPMPLSFYRNYHQPKGA